MIRYLIRYARRREKTRRDLSREKREVMVYVGVWWVGRELGSGVLIWTQCPKVHGCPKPKIFVVGPAAF